MDPPNILVLRRMDVTADDPITVPMEGKILEQFLLLIDEPCVLIF